MKFAQFLFYLRYDEKFAYTKNSCDDPKHKLTLCAETGNFAIAFISTLFLTLNEFMF